MFCANCGAEINDKAVVCVHCGTQTQGGRIPSFSHFKKSGFSKEEVTLPCRLTAAQVDERMCNLKKHGVPFALVGRNVLQNGFEYSLTANISWLSWGELLYVKAEASGAGSLVNVFSKCCFPLQIASWGKHGQNIRMITAALEIS